MKCQISSQKISFGGHSKSGTELSSTGLQTGWGPTSEKLCTNAIQTKTFMDFHLKRSSPLIISLTVKPHLWSLGQNHPVAIFFFFFTEEEKMFPRHVSKYAIRIGSGNYPLARHYLDSHSSTQLNYKRLWHWPHPFFHSKRWHIKETSPTGSLLDWQITGHHKRAFCFRDFDSLMLKCVGVCFEVEHDHAVI